MRLTHVFSIASLLLLPLGREPVAFRLDPSAQQASRYPVPPAPLPEAEEIALAMSAAPEEISSRADIYVLRAGGPVKARPGTNGSACMVARDLHEGSRYPICFDSEGARTLLLRELKELALRAKGMSEAQVRSAVDAAYASGELKAPAKAAVAYMMSPGQVLFSSTLAEGRRVGAWHPHLMIAMPFVTKAQFGLAAESTVDVISLDHEGTAAAQLIVKVPAWSDGTPAGAQRR